MLGRGRVGQVPLEDGLLVVVEAAHPLLVVEVNLVPSFTAACMAAAAAAAAGRLVVDHVDDLVRRAADAGTAAADDDDRRKLDLEVACG